MIVDDEAARVLGDGPVRTTPLTHNQLNSTTAGIWRVGVGDRSAVLKVLTAGHGASGRWASSEDPRRWNYWRREAEAYATGLTDEWRPAGLRAPNLLARFDRDDGDIALWLEDIAAPPASRAAVADLGVVARRLGRAQGRPEAGEPPWTSRRFLREYTASKSFDHSLLHDDRAWGQPLVQEHWPAELRPAMVRLHEEREWFLAVMEGLPRARCHLDVWPHNLFLEPDGDAVLVDWAFVGDGTLGEDLGNLIPDSVFDLFVTAARLPDLDRLLFAEYVAGLHEAGWDGEVDRVRLAVCASAVKYHWLTTVGLEQASAEVQLDYGGGTPVDAARRYRERGLALAFLAGWADEARRLAPRLGFRP